MFFVIPGIMWLKVTVAGIIAGGAVMLGIGVGVAIINANSPVPNADSILSRIHETSTLVTEKATYDVYVSSGIIDGFQGANSYSGVFTGIGEIHAGIDLTQMTKDDISFENDVFRIKLPPPQFTTCVLSDFRQVSHSFSILAVNWDFLYTLASIDAYHSTTFQGVEGGLLELAELNAGAIVAGLVSELTGKETIITHSGEQRGANSDPRCAPPFPAGWGKEDLGHHWVRLPPTS